MDHHTATDRSTPRTRRPRRLVAAALSVLIGLVALTPLTATPASAATGADVSATVDPANGFPTWYQDESGRRLAPCLDAGDPNCVVLADATYDPAKPQSFPANFPSEFFYALADSVKLDTKGCSGTKPGKFSVRMGLEGAFANGTPAAGDQMVFGRVRVIATGGLCKTSTYAVTSPYGQISFTTDASGALARNQGTTDVGCVPVAPTACDWRVALSSKVAKSFLRWDPAFGPAAPSGYLGDATTAHRVLGAAYTAPGESTPANYVRLTGPSLSSPLQTNLFTVSGKLAGPLVASPSAVDFGGQPVGQAATRTVVVTNLAADPVTPGPATVTGGAAGDFSVVDDGCRGVSLVRDASCTLTAGFDATASGSRTTTLSVPHSGVRSPFSVTLSGTGTSTGDQAKAGLSATSLDFGDQRIGTRSAVRRVTVSSTGTAPLEVSAVRLSGASPDQFTVTADGCTGTPVAVGGTCTLDVAFDPSLAQVSRADVQITSNTDPMTVTVQGRGYGGVAKVSAGTGDDGFPDWYQDERGVRLVQCIDPTDPNCTVLPGGTYAGRTPLSFPDNFPDEFFYSVVDSDVVTTPGCNGTAPGKAMIRMAVEGAFGTGEPLAGDQMTFGRIRVFATGGLCPSTTYTFVHPYGSDQFTTDADGGIKRSPGTDDVGCLGAGPAAPCDFGLAVKSRVFGGFLKWDPASGPAAPAGYLGDGATLHRIVGAPYTAPGESAPANSFRILQGDTVVGQTNLFTVMGKLGGPLVATPSTLDGGSVAVGDSSTGTVTLANQGIDDLRVRSAAPTGGQAADFSVPSATDHCTGTTLKPGDTCTLAVAFAPGGVGDRASRLLVDHTGLNNPLPVALSGVGLSAGGTAALSADRTGLTFADLHVGRTSAAQTVTVSNKGGSAPLHVDGVDIAGPDAADFSVAANSCQQDVAPDATCAVRVVFSPAAGGARTATLRVSAATASPASVSVPLDGTGFAGSSAVSAGVRPSDGFPSWYQDSNGVRLAPCLDAADPRCVVLGGPGYDPAAPLSFPDNYPPEFFYALADSEAVTTPGCQGTAPGTAMLRLALEGSFASPTAQAGQQLTFGRIRFHATSGLCPDTTYTVTTPYGTLTATTNADGAVARNAATTDVGCGAAPCGFGGALGSDVAGGFLRWAPGSGAAAPAGYLGDGVSLHEVVGATNTVGGSPANFFEISAPDGTSVARTSKFIVSGKLAAGLEAPATAFRDQQIGTTSAASTLTFTNVGRTPLQVGSIAPAGADAAAFSVVPGGTCAGSTVAGDASCTVRVTFAPTATQPYAARVRVLAPDGSLLGTGDVAGHGIDVGAPRAVVGPTSLAFADQRVATTSGGQNLQVTNTGTAPLHVGPVTVSGPAAGDFAAAKAATCDTVAPGGTCGIVVRFTPSAAGSRTATLSVASDDPGGARTVALSGAGVSSVVTLGSTSLDFGKQSAGKPVTKTVTVTNSGTAPLTISGVSVDDATNFSVTRGTCTTAVAVKRSCEISVTFRAVAPLGAKSSRVRFTSDATNAPTLAVTGTVS